MNRAIDMQLFVVLLVLALVCASPLLAVDDIHSGELFTLTGGEEVPNGGWCWFQDERAIIDDRHPGGPLLLVSSVSAGRPPEGGDIDLLWRNLKTGEQGHFELDDQLQQDDHNVAALYVRPDGRYLALWSKHGVDSVTRRRLSIDPHDPARWNPVQTLDNRGGTTYNNVYYLPEEDGGKGRLYNFTRARNFDPNVQVSNDHGSTWHYAGKLLTEGGRSDRPYVRYASDGKRIHLLTTERHPRNFANSIYHGYVQNGVLYNSMGAIVDSSIFDEEGVAPARLTPVFLNDSSLGTATMNRAWTISLEIDELGQPVGVVSARVEDRNQDHRFLYVCFDGTFWHVHEMAKGGGYLYRREDDYTGLAAIDPDDTSVVYVSTNIDPRSGGETHHYEIYRGKTPDAGATWQWTAITENSTVDNLRPVVPAYNRHQTVLLWLRGEFNTFTDYNTQVTGLVLSVGDL